MEERYHCIICSKPLEKSGLLGSINDITVSLCKDHAGICSMQCEGCTYENTCTIKARFK